VAAGESVDPAHWQVRFNELLGRIAGRFARVEPRRRVRAFVAGLLAELPRKNCWTLAEHAGEASPDGMQHLLARAVWDADAVRDDVRDYLMEHLADPDAVPVVDETGDRKKAATPSGSSGSTPAPPAGPRTPRSRSGSSTPPRLDMG
jgi:SRSO17 transposase